jgi:drug/metabolite transporter superfamily protein YnfA
MNSFAWLIFLVAAIMEVAGDAVIRKGMRGGGLLLILGGAVVLACYGVTVNMVKWDFSRLLGIYVAVFACVAVVIGRWYFKETVPPTTWLGLVFIVIGGLIIQFGKQG